MEKFKEYSVFVMFGGLTAFMLFAMGIDSIFDAGFFGAICGTLTCILIGGITGFIAQILYWCMQKICPQTLQKIDDYLEDEGPAFDDED